MKIVVLYSGGIDSLALYHYAKKLHPNAEIIAVYYNIGSGESTKEIPLLPEFVEVKNIDWLDNGGSLSIQDKRIGNYFVPGRNSVFVQLAAFQYLPDQVWLGILHGEDTESLKDRRQEFLEMTNNIINYILLDYDKTCIVRTPFVEYSISKNDTVPLLIECGVDTSVISSVPTCFSYDTFACGTCAKCFKLAMSLYENGILDIDKFDEHPLQSNFANKYIKSLILQKQGKDKITSDDTLTYMWPVVDKLYRDDMLSVNNKELYENS